jgi:hypothetical protein
MHIETDDMDPPQKYHTILVSTYPLVMIVTGRKHDVLNGLYLFVCRK